MFLEDGVFLLNLLSDMIWRQIPLVALVKDLHMELSRGKSFSADAFGLPNSFGFYGPY